MRRIKLLIWIAVISALIVVAIPFIITPDTSVTVTASGYVIADLDIEGQIYIENPDGTITIVLGDE